jgi:hypothetical protein
MTIIPSCSLITLSTAQDIAVREKTWMDLVVRGAALCTSTRDHRLKVRQKLDFIIIIHQFSQANVCLCSITKNKTDQTFRATNKQAMWVCINRKQGCEHTVCHHCFQVLQKKQMEEEDNNGSTSRTTRKRSRVP